MMHVNILAPNTGQGHVDRGRFAFERFRHEHYCERLRWEPKRSDGRETDEYDSSSTYITVVEEGIIVGGCRLVPSFATDHPLPLESEFTGHLIRPSYEASRIIISIDTPANPSREQCRANKARRCAIARRMYDTAFQVVERNRAEAAYIVVEPKFLHCLQRMYSREVFAPLGNAYEVTHGVRTFTHLAVHVRIAAWKRSFSASMGSSEPVVQEARPRASLYGAPTGASMGSSEPAFHQKAA